MATFSPPMPGIPQTSSPMDGNGLRDPFARPPSLQAREDRLLTTALRHWSLAEDFEREWREKALLDLRFRYGDQWDPAVVRSRMQGPAPRPILTINLLPARIRQIANEARQQRPSMKVSPVDNAADIATANAFKGILRHIEYVSSASDAYDWAREMAATIGKGWIRVRRDYDEPWSFQQSIFIDRIFNPFSIYADPAGRQTPDYRQMQWLFDVDYLSKDTFCQRYEVDPVLYGRWASAGDAWVMRDEARVANYWYFAVQPITLVQIVYPDQSTHLRFVPRHARSTTDATPPDEDLLQQVLQRMLEQGVFPLSPTEEGLIRRHRPSEVAILYCAKLNGHTILEHQASPGSYIPYVPMLGEELLIEGKVDYRGIIRDAIEPQREVNVLATKIQETLGLAPSAAYVGAVEQFKDRPEWATANIIPRSFLAYNPAMVGGQVLPPPQREVAEPAIQAICLAQARAEQHLNAVMGMYPPMLGDGKADESGVARRESRQQSELGASHYALNEERAINHLARILVDLVPPTYVEPERMVRMLGEDGSQEMIQLDPRLKTAQADIPRDQLPKGVEGIYNLTVGKYDVATETGPSYKTKQEAQRAGIVELAKVMPKVADIGAHIIVGAQDFEGKDELSRMLKKMLPPGLQDEADQNQKPEDRVIALEAQLQKLAQDQQALNAHAQQMEQALHQVTQENHDLKQKHDIAAQTLLMKQQQAVAELDLKRREAQLEADIALRKVAIEQEKVDLDRLKLHLEREAMQVQAHEGNGP